MNWPPKTYLEAVAWALALCLALTVVTPIVAGLIALPTGCMWHYEHRIPGIINLCKDH